MIMVWLFFFFFFAVRKLLRCVLILCNIMFFSYLCIMYMYIYKSEENATLKIGVFDAF